MRYKVRAPDDAAFDDLRKFLAEHAELLVASPHRRTLSTGELSEATRKEIRGRGGEVLEDRQYEPG